MFRRKEDEVSQDLLGNPEAANTGTESAESMESVKPTTATAPTPISAAPVNPYSRTTAATPAAAPMTASTPVYRPAAAPAAEARARVPEYRPAGTPPLPASLTSAASSGFDKAKSGNRRVLTVGNDILLKGEIATCDRLVIEGAVDATLKEVHTVEIAEGGSFKGYAEIEDAEISGLFEGELVVRNRLVIYSTGKVRGKITYGEIEIERGGEMTGEIKTVDEISGKAFTGKKLEAA